MNFYLYQKDVVTIPPYITRGTEPKNKSAEQRRPRKNANAELVAADAHKNSMKLTYMS